MFPWYCWLLIGFAIFFFLIAVYATLVHEKSKNYIVPMGHPYFPHVNDEFPDDENGHEHVDKKYRTYVYDDKFPYRYKQRLWLRLGHMVSRFLIELFGPCIIKCYSGLIYKNKSVFRRNRKLLKNGYITVSNHVMMLDTVAHICGNWGRYPEIPMMWAVGEGKYGPLFRMGGGIPIPRNIKGMYYSYQAMLQVLSEKKWLHIFPEGSGWAYYVPIRKLKDGTFKLACEANVPVIPAALSYRKRHGLFKIFHTNHPLCTMSYGEPILPDKSLPRNEAIAKMKAETYLAMIHLAGIESLEQNEEFKRRYKYYHYVEGVSHASKF